MAWLANSIFFFLFCLDLCCDETDNSPPLQLHTLKEFEQVRVLFWILIWLDVNDTSLSFIHNEASNERSIGKRALQCHLVASCASTRSNELILGLLWCSILTMRLDHCKIPKSMVISKLSWILFFFFLNHTENNNTCSRWKTPWILLVVKICLWLQDGLL